MKKILTILSLLCISLVACGDKDDDTKPAENKEENQNINNSEKQDNIETEKQEMKTLIITVSGKSLEADFADNSSAKALADVLAKSSITYQADDYGNFEKVGDLGQSFPKNDENITTEPGDIILYQGHNLCIYYAQNTWSFTRIAKIKGVSKDELKEFLGEGEITVTLSVEK